MWEKCQITYIIMKIILTLTPFCDTLMAYMMGIGSKERTWWHHGLQQQTTSTAAPGWAVGSDGGSVQGKLCLSQLSQSSFFIPTNGSESLFN